MALPWEEIQPRRSRSSTLSPNVPEEKNYRTGENSWGWGFAVFEVGKFCHQKNTHKKTTEYCFIPSSNLCLKRSTLSFFFSPTCARTSWCETLWVRRHPLLVGHFSHSGTPEAEHRCGFNRSWCLNPLFSRTEDSQFSV